MPNSNHTNIDSWINHQENDHHLSHSMMAKYEDEQQQAHTISIKLQKKYPISPDHAQNIRNYSSSSRDLNSRLVSGKDLGDYNIKKSMDMDKIIDGNRIKEPLTVYSGAGFDPREHINSDGVMHSPAYISATHSKSIASDFAGIGMSHTDNDHHILSISLKQNDPAMHMFQHSNFPEEHETLIKKGVKMKLLKTQHIPKNTSHNGVNIHHLEIV